MFTVDRLLRGSVAKDAASTLDHPLEHLVACHGRIEERLSILERAAAHLDSKPEEARQAIESVFRYFETSGVAHTADEEQSVFPRIEERLTPEEKAYIASLESQHREADELYERLKQVPAPGQDPEPYRRVVAQFAALYRSHIASENDRLIAVGKRLLTAAELETISAEMRQRRFH
ncbi:MAG TPA: hemerythrin domain-containing protein [Bryobacteraceae bacterium]|nr:hemerythrin domain-containing protein [Bryobacteraceae bacterium]